MIGALVAGGAERSSKDLVIAQRAMGREAELACLSPQSDGATRAWTEELSAAGVPLHIGPTRRLSVRRVLWLRTLLSAPDVAVVHLHLDYAEVTYYFARFLHRRKYGVLRKIHTTEPPTHPLYRWVLRHSDVRVYYSCGAEAHEAFKGVVPGEQVLIPNGLRFDWPVRDLAERDARLAALRQNAALTHYMHVGRHGGETVATSQKAQDTLIRAWRHAKLGERGGVLHFFGDGNLRPEHEQLAGRDPSIVFHGVVANVHEWLSACDVFVLPSRWEGLPLSGVEAVATGIPCVLSDIPPNRELGSTVASFAPVDDVEALAEKLEERLGKREAAAPEAVRSQRETWGVERAVRQFFDVYDRLCPGAGA